MFLAPAAVLLLVFFMHPTLQTIWWSFHGGIGLEPSRFVGADNYVRLLTGDPLFLNLEVWPPSGALVNNLLWLALFTLSPLGLGLSIAVLADGVRYERTLKAVIFLPMVISATAASVIFRFVYSPDPTIGILNAVLGALFPWLEPVPWLGRRSVVNFALIGAAVWIWTGLATTVLSAAYKALDREVLEAANVDGAGPWRTFWRVALPMLAGPIAFVAIALVINGLKMLELVLVMTAGGPRGASRIIGFTVYWEMFNNSRAGYGSAVAVVMLLLLVPVIAVQLRRVGREER
ncbi:MAG: sugar ABC transporter permease [Candidatus Lambdaproteobacteria bacterium]|nr:sugar ABC transporter permease [Candidatus Lambdaproteobacteria bacterium]